MQDFYFNDDSLLGILTLNFKKKEGILGKGIGILPPSGQRFQPLSSNTFFFNQNYTNQLLFSNIKAKITNP
jgi:hypothetical protein